MGEVAVMPPSAPKGVVEGVDSARRLAGKNMTFKLSDSEAQEVVQAARS